MQRLCPQEQRSGEPTNQLTGQLVKARVDAMRNYPWSSYRCYVESIKKPGWLTTAAVLELIGKGTR
jgi:hypothetical protein